LLLLLLLLLLHCWMTWTEKNDDFGFGSESESGAGLGALQQSRLICFGTFHCPFLVVHVSDGAAWTKGEEWTLDSSTHAKGVCLSSWRECGLFAATGGS